jgi:hypothetical protein
LGKKTRTDRARSGKKSDPFNRSIQYYFPSAFPRKLHALKACEAITKRQRAVRRGGASSNGNDDQTAMSGRGAAHQLMAYKMHAIVSIEPFTIREAAP